MLSFRQAAEKRGGHNTKREQICEDMSAFNEYLVAIKREFDSDAATENTYRPALKTLLETYGEGIRAINEPKRALCGAPDFNITRKNVLLGYIETKDIGTSLEEME
jgi:hypothetical protein